MKKEKTFAFKISDKEREMMDELRTNGFSISRLLRNSIKEKYFIIKDFPNLIKKDDDYDMEQSKNNTVNADFFDVIDTEEKAYYIGLILADGQLTSSGYGICISLKKNDQYLVDRFANIFDVTTYIHKYKKSSEYSVDCCVYSKYIWSSLYKKGIFPKKSGKEDQLIIKFIPYNLQNHFIRGYFDGDGSVYLTKRHDGKTSQISIEFAGGYEFLKELGIFMTKFGLRSRDPKPCSNTKIIYRLRYYTCDDAKKFYDFVYDNATIYMERKKNIFENYI